MRGASSSCRRSSCWPVAAPAARWTRRRAAVRRASSKTPDAHTLLLPDAPGNNRLDSFSNIVESGARGPAVPDPRLRRDAARQRRAVLSTDPADIACCTDDKRAPKLVIRVGRAGGVPALRQGLHALQAVERRQPRAAQCDADDGPDAQRPDRHSDAARDAGRDGAALRAGPVSGMATMTAGRDACVCRCSDCRRCWRCWRPAVPADPSPPTCRSR